MPDLSSNLFGNLGPEPRRPVDPAPPPGPGEQRENSRALVPLNINPQVQLLVSFLHDESPFVRRSAAERLGKLGWEGNDALPHLAFSAEHERVPLVQKACVKALAEIKPQGVPSLIYLATFKDREGLRADAIDALGGIDVGAESALPALEHIVRHEQGPIAKKALGAIKGILRRSLPASFLSGSPVKAMNGLGEILINAPKESPEMPAATVGEAKAARLILVNALINMYQGLPDKNVAGNLKDAARVMPMARLSRMEQIYVSGFLAYGFAREDAAVRVELAKCLRTAGMKRGAVGPLVSLAMNTEADPPAGEYLRALGGDTRSRRLGAETLTPHAQNPLSPHCGRALEVLGSLTVYPSDAVMQIYRAALASEDSDVRTSALSGLVEMRPYAHKDAMQLFTNLLRDPDPLVRVGASTAFKEFLHWASDESRGEGIALLKGILAESKPARGVSTSDFEDTRRRALEGAVTLASASPTPPDHRDTVFKLLASACMGKESTDVRSAAYEGLFKLARREKPGEFKTRVVQALDWALEEEDVKQNRGQLVEYLRALADR